MILNALLVLASAAAQPAVDEAVLTVVDEFFLAFERADTEKLRSLMDDRFSITALAPGKDEGAPVSRVSLADAWLQSLEGQEGVLVELYWDPVVQIAPTGLAHVWAPYYIEAGGNPVHCGHDAFTLIKREGGWKISDVHYTGDPQSCEDLGLDEAAERLRPAALRARLTREFP